MIVRCYKLNFYVYGLWLGCVQTHSEVDGLQPATVLPPALAQCTVHQLVGGDTLHGNTLSVRQHPNHNIGDRVLGLYSGRDK